MAEAAASGLALELAAVVLHDPASAVFRVPLYDLLGDRRGEVEARMASRWGLSPPPTTGPDEVVQRIVESEPVGAPGGALNAVTSVRAGFVDPRARIQAVTDLMARTVMIEVAGTPKGTGFLIAEDLVLTAAHVLDPIGVASRADAPGEGRLRPLLLGLAPEEPGRDRCARAGLRARDRQPPHRPGGARRGGGRLGRAAGSSRLRAPQARHAGAAARGRAARPLPALRGSLPLRRGRDLHDHAAPARRLPGAVGVLRDRRGERGRHARPLPRQHAAGIVGLAGRRRPRSAGGDPPLLDRRSQPGDPDRQGGERAAQRRVRGAVRAAAPRSRRATCWRRSTRSPPAPS